MFLIEKILENEITGKFQAENLHRTYCRYSEAVVQKCSVKKFFLEISQNSQENTCARVSFLTKLKALGFILQAILQVLGLRSFFNKVAGPANLLKRRLRHRCFSANFVKFLRTPFFIEHLWWKLLGIFK